MRIGRDLIEAGKELAKVQRVCEIQESMDILEHPEKFVSMKDYMRVTDVSNLEEVRKPENLSVVISDSLYRNDITPAKWKDATPIQRNEMMDKAFNIMLEKMSVPKSLNVAFDHIGTKENVAGECNLFVTKSPDDSLVFNKEVRPRVSMNCNLMYEEDIHTALNSVFHQALLVMQQVSCTNPSTASFHPDWVKEINFKISGNHKGIDGAMQRYVRNAEVVFEKQYDAIVAANKLFDSQLSFKG